MKKMNYNNVYGAIGKIICSCAGAIVGFLAGGTTLALLGIPCGYIFAQFLESHLSLKKS